MHGSAPRLPYQDYRLPGAYCVTLVTAERRCLFGRLGHRDVELGLYGWIAVAEWISISRMRARVSLLEYVVMPDHVHGLLVFEGERHHDEPAAATRFLRRTPSSLGSVVAGCKSAVTARLRRITGDVGLVVWQKGFYDRIVRSERELARLRRYIANNPQRAILDRAARTQCGPTGD